MLYIEYASHVFADCVEEQRKENKQPADETQELKEEVWVPNKQPAAEAQELIEKEPKGPRNSQRWSRKNSLEKSLIHGHFHHIGPLGLPRPRR